MSGTILVAWRDDGFWSLLWLRFLFGWMGWRPRHLPPRGFVGRASGSLAGTGVQLLSARLTRRSLKASTPDAPAWRLTCEWVINQPASRLRNYGRSSARIGNDSEAVGAAGSLPRT